MTPRDAFIAEVENEARAAFEKWWASDAAVEAVLNGSPYSCARAAWMQALAAEPSSLKEETYRAAAYKWQEKWREARREVLEEARRYAVHKTKCRAWPAFSEEQILRDCDCGYVTLFGWSSGNVGALSAAPPAGAGEKEPEWCELCGHTGWLRDADGNRTERCPCAPVSELGGR